MVKKISTVSDFVETVAAYNEIRSGLSARERDNVAVMQKLLEFSEPIIGFNNKAVEEHTTNYSVAAVRLVGELKLGAVKQRSVSEWSESAKRAITSFFLVLSGDRRYELVTDDEDDALLEDFFYGGDFYSTAAYYLAVRRLARKKPLYCCERTLEIFGEYPELVSKLYNELSYVYIPDVAREDIVSACPICGSSESEPYYCADLTLSNDPRFAPARLWMKCGGCGGLYAHNFPLAAIGDVNGHYTAENSGRLLTPRNMLWVYSEIFNRAASLCGGKRYLEIGVGTGEMLAVALEMGYDADAVDICREDCDNVSAALGVEVICSDFLQLATDKRYDLISMGNVLECFTRPTDALRKAHEMLGENGVLWLSTPNYDSAFARMRKFSDPVWGNKEQLTYFSFDVLKPFLEDIGFAVRRYDASNRRNGSMELFLQKI